MPGFTIVGIYSTAPIALIAADYHIYGAHADFATFHEMAVFHGYTEQNVLAGRVEYHNPDSREFIVELGHCADCDSDQAAFAVQCLQSAARVF